MEHEHKTEMNKDSTCTEDPDINKTDVENSNSDNPVSGKYIKTASISKCLNIRDNILNPCLFFKIGYM